MNRTTLAAIATLAGTGTALAGGLDRSGQNIEILFEPGNIVELSLGYVRPHVTGRDVALFGGRKTGNVADSFYQGGIAYKQDINDALSFAFIIDQPYGANIDYDAATATDGSIALGGTEATLDSVAYTGLLRYKFNDRFSVHGGLRAQQLNANVTLQGAAYGPLGAGDGYNVDFDGDTAYGYQLGASYEIPEIALRVSATYFSEIDHDLKSRERTPLGRVPGTSNTETTTPRAVNINGAVGHRQGHAGLRRVPLCRLQRHEGQPRHLRRAHRRAEPDRHRHRPRLPHRRRTQVQRPVLGCRLDQLYRQGPRRPGLAAGTDGRAPRHHRERRLQRHRAGPPVGRDQLFPDRRRERQDRHPRDDPLRVRGQPSLRHRP